MARARSIRLFEFEKGQLKGHAERQQLYMDMSTGELIPNTEVWVDGKLDIQINALGCTGPELSPGVPVLALFGDSTAFGTNGESWVAKLNLPGMQVLNAAVEGYSLKRAIQRYEALRSLVQPSAVVICAGWHNLIYNETGPEFWARMFDRLSDEQPVVLCSPLCALRDECRFNGITEHLYVHEKEPSFHFFGYYPPTVAHIAEILDRLVVYREFLADYCARRGFKFLDLTSIMRPNSYQEIPRDFFDICHPRMERYEYFAARITPELRALL